MPKKEKEIDTIAVIAKFTDGSFQQVLLDKNTDKLILNTIMSAEGKISVRDTNIEGIEF